MISGSGAVCGERARLVQRVDDRALDDRLADLDQQVLEQLAVLRLLDRVERRAEQPDAVLVEDAQLGQLRRRG